MPYIESGPIKRIHINGSLLRKKLKACKPIAIRVRGKVKRASEVVIDGSSMLVYRPKSPLSGTTAVLWIQTKAKVYYT